MKFYQVTMPDGSKWNVPLELIARDHARYYATIDYAGDVETCFREHSLPLMLSDPSEVRDWASGNMNWVDVVSSAVMVDKGSAAPDAFQDGWVNGSYRIIDVETAASSPAGTAMTGPATAPAEWIRTDVSLPSPDKIAASRCGNVETAGKNSRGEWFFAYTPARNVVFDPQYYSHWRYLPAAPQ